MSGRLGQHATRLKQENCPLHHNSFRHAHLRAAPQRRRSI